MLTKYKQYKYLRITISARHFDVHRKRNRFTLNYNVTVHNVSSEWFWHRFSFIISPNCLWNCYIDHNRLISNTGRGLLHDISGGKNMNLNG